MTYLVVTSKSRVVLKCNGNLDEVDHEMMEGHWKVFQFTHQIAYDEQREVEPCGSCFSELVLMGEINLKRRNTKFTMFFR